MGGACDETCPPVPQMSISNESDPSSVLKVLFACASQPYLPENFSLAGDGELILAACAA